MSAPARINFTAYQGSTLREVLRWEGSKKAYTLITAISNTAPVVITAPGHGVPLEWRIKLTNIGGMVELNSTEAYHQVTGITEDTITINSINSVSYRAYTTGGVVEFNTPISLTGYTARMQIRERLTSPTIIYELTTENGGITFNSTNNTIELNIPAEITTEFNFISSVYSLEVESSTGTVTTIASGNLNLVKEVTR